jgi:hypothetical protein
MNTIHELVTRIEHLKLLKVLDWERKFHSWYDGEIEVLGLELRALFQKPQ